MRLPSFAVMVVLCGLASMDALAQAVYKHVDKDGKVHYSDKPPTKDEGVKKLDIDSNRNVVPPLVGKSSEQGGGGDKARIDRRIEKQDSLLADLNAAKDRLAAAKAALEEGMEIQEGDMDTVQGPKKIGRGGKVISGPPRAIPNEQYQERIKGLEEAVKSAEADLAKAETAYRRGVPN
jgi:hypothetical protein